ncbi:hypothetical protein [uncultured Lamprocystis sp.]|jgi:hypothetical protein|uniref:hypothetical protein n=1 Tax=uncultured Lamprocystis sp. TaxID=543132 RepID=UPI0025D169AF|nr:hypothetical protein [uncultured Lamprocystis sp.]
MDWRQLPSRLPRPAAEQRHAMTGARPPVAPRTAADLVELVGLGQTAVAMPGKH